MDKKVECKENSRQKKFLLKQLIHRDFKSRYKRTFLGVLWSMLSPLCFFVTQAIVFSKLFGRGEHFLSYLIIGNMVYHYFSDATTNLMFSISANGGIISKINVDKKLFIYSRSISCLINFLLTLIIMFGVIAINGISFNVKFILLIFPIVCLYFLNMGIGYILSVLYVFFKDTQYLYSICTRMLTYFSAIFYYVDSFPENVRHLFFYNPVYCYIYYFRTIIIDNVIPSVYIHVMCAAFPVVFFIIGKVIYKVNEKKFVYYF